MTKYERKYWWIDGRMFPPGTYYWNAATAEWIERKSAVTKQRKIKLKAETAR